MTPSSNTGSVRKVVETRLPTQHGEFRLQLFVSVPDGKEHVALIQGVVDDGAPVLTRVHSECLTGDVFGSLRCDCNAQLTAALDRVNAQGRGVVIYLRQEGRGIGLQNKLKAYELQDRGMDTVEANEHLGFEADAREYRIAAEILLALGIHSVRLLTNNPEKVRSLEEEGVTVAERIPLEVGSTDQNESYLRVKREKLGHLFSGDPGHTGR